MKSDKHFSGVGDVLNALVAGRENGAWLRSRAAEDSLLHELADLIGQAYGNVPAADGIVAAAADRRQALAIRLEAADTLLAMAARDLPIRTAMKPSPEKPGKRS
jgi:hypothetical protein